MNDDSPPTEILERAQELFKQNYARCFWHLKPDLIVTQDDLPIIIKGLRAHGGRSGFLAAAMLEKERRTSCP